ncbi:MAG: response regulator transcription factor, partial [Elusimicrobiota bacterium]
MKKNPPDKIFKILVVEDEESCLKLIKVVLEKEDYVVNSLNRGEYVLEEIQIFQPDLLVLDMDLPDITGWDLLKIIRSDKFLYSLLVLAISGKYAHSLHSIRALGEFGADDYLPKPFGYQLFISHVKALLRRKFWDTERELRTMRSGPITLDLSNRQAFFNGSPVHLTSSEFKVLFELLRNRGKALDRNRLLESIMGYSSGEYETRNVDKHIESLRRKIPEYSKRIVTVREIGYKFFVFLLLVLSQFSVLRADYTDTLRCLGKLIERVDKRPDDRVALKSLNDEIKKLISDEIHLRKREARGIMQQTQRKLKKIFSEALDNYNKKKYLFASEGFKCIAAYKPTDRKTKDYLYKNHSEMSALASCEV